MWNVARFSSRFLDGYRPAGAPTDLTPADRWILARTQAVVARCTQLWRAYDYATAKSEVEVFFWRDLADNYLEMVKKRLYDGQEADGATYALYQSLLATVKLLAPILPHVTEKIYQGLFAIADGSPSVHRGAWPQADARWEDESAVRFGELLVDVATAVRRHKSEQNLSLGTELRHLQLAADNTELAARLRMAVSDLQSITRAEQVSVDGRVGAHMAPLGTIQGIEVGLLM
jgi:valyl-tRNA synthetase